MSIHVFAILTFESPILGARLGGVPIDVGGALRRQWRTIDDSPAAIGDHLDLDSVGPDEVVRLVSVTDVAGKADRGTRQTCRRGQE